MLDGYEQFKQDIFALTKIDLNCYREKQMKRRIDTLIGQSNVITYKSYVELLKTDTNALEQFINYLTINVSEFYRNPEQWVLLEKNIFPEMIRRFGEKLKIWSAACSTGDEPYSIVMALSRHLPLSKIQVIATDIDKQVLEKAKIGLYSKKSIANVPNDLKKRYFKKNGEFFHIADEIKKCVQFRQHNLLEDVYPAHCNMIVCRNVVIYFTDEAKKNIYLKFNRSLKNQGFLFIGNTELFMECREVNFKRYSTFFFEKP